VLPARARRGAEERFSSWSSSGRVRLARIREGWCRTRRHRGQNEEWDDRRRDSAETACRHSRAATAAGERANVIGAVVPDAEQDGDDQCATVPRRESRIMISGGTAQPSGAARHRKRGHARGRVAGGDVSNSGRSEDWCAPAKNAWGAARPSRRQGLAAEKPTEEAPRTARGVTRPTRPSGRVHADNLPSSWPGPSQGKDPEHPPLVAAKRCKASTRTGACSRPASAGRPHCTCRYSRLDAACRHPVPPSCCARTTTVEVVGQDEFRRRTLTSASRCRMVRRRGRLRMENGSVLLDGKASVAAR